MSSRKRKKNEQTAAAKVTPVVDATKIRIANGAGRKPIVVDYVQGETFEQLFKRTGVKPSEKQIVTYGKKTVGDFTELVEPGITITIANKPHNG